jgi:hypothetical protein
VLPIGASPCAHRARTIGPPGEGADPPARGRRPRPPRDHRLPVGVGGEQDDRFVERTTGDLEADRQARAADVPTVIHGPRDLLRIRDLGQPYDRFRVHALRMPVLVRPRPTPRRPGSTSDATAWTEKVGRKGADCERAPAKSLDGGHSVEWSPRRSLPWFVAGDSPCVSLGGRLVPGVRGRLHSAGAPGGSRRSRTRALRWRRSPRISFREALHVL